MKPLWVTFVALIGIAASAAELGPAVTVTGGQIRGAVLKKGGAVFKSIPFAQPPVGNLRWREPMPVKPWAGVRDTSRFSSPCAQILPNFLVSDVTEVKEDCLYLNIWTPEWPSRVRRPVMVWIHGGGNSGGFSASPVYDGEELASHGVVLVSTNYRVGVLGFLAHPELTKESPHHASGNYGILDQIEALHWVHDNIATFGGDPTNVTIFGQSAGSVDVSMLMTSPLAKGLFRRVIAESGAVVGLGEPETLSRAEKRGEALAEDLKVPSSASLKNLRALTTAEIQKAAPSLVLSPRRSLGIVVDGYVFPKAPGEVFASSRQSEADLILGNNASERVASFLPPTDLKKAIEDKDGPFAARVLALYEQSRPDPLYGTPAEQWATDTSFRCSAVAQLVWHSAAGHAAYEYEFDRVPHGREAVGVTHAAELWYVFGTLALGESNGVPKPQYNAVDQQVSNAMQRYWTNFAKTGNPNDGKLPQWPKFEATSRAYMEFKDDSPVARKGLRRAFCDLYIENARRLITK